MVRVFKRFLQDRVRLEDLEEFLTEEVENVGSAIGSGQSVVCLHPKPGCG